MADKLVDGLPDTSLAVMPGHTLVGRVARAMRSGLGAAGVNILNASGPGSDQSVPHLHFHVIPRWEGDGFTTWPCLPARSNISVEGSPEDVLAAALA